MQFTMNKQLALFVSQSMSTLLNIQNTTKKLQWPHIWPCLLVNVYFLQQSNGMSDSKQNMLELFTLEALTSRPIEMFLLCCSEPNENSRSWKFLWELASFLVAKLPDFWRRKNGFWVLGFLDFWILWRIF